MEKQLYKERDKMLTLSNTNRTGKGLGIVGALVVLIFGAILIKMCIDPIFLLQPILKIPVFFTLSAIIAIGFSAIYYSRLKTVNIDYSHIYNPTRIAFHRLTSAVFACIIMGSFLAAFAAVGWYFRTGFLVFTGVFGLIIFAGIAFELNKIRKLFINASAFGNTEIRIQKSSVFLNDLLQIEIKNSDFQKLLPIQATLRNLEERWESKKGKREKTNLNTYILFEQSSTILPNQTSNYLNFEIPDSACKASSLEILSPIYWELELKNEAKNYYSRFFIEVKNPDTSRKIVKEKTSEV